jgi:hypothetical protein
METSHLQEGDSHKMAIPMFRKALTVITSLKLLPVIILVFRALIDKGILGKLRDYHPQRDKFSYEIAMN